MGTSNGRAHQEEHWCVSELPVTELVSQHCYNLILVALGAKRIVENDSLVIPEAVHVGIGMS